MDSNLFGQYQQQIIPVLEKYQVPKAAFFGSLVDGSFGHQSDVDIVIEPAPKMSLLGLAGLQLELKSILNREVDVLTYQGIHPALKDIIMNQQRIFYEKK